MEEERIQPTIKETSQKMIIIPDNSEVGNMNKGPRKNSLTKSLSQISIISSLLQEAERNFVPSHLYATPKSPPSIPEKVEKPPTNESKVETVSPEPLQANDAIPKDVSSKVSNLMQDQEKNLQMPPQKGPSSTITLLPDLKRKISIIVWLGATQLLMSVILVALGGLMIARNASLAGCGAGVWAGGVAGITGAFGVMGNIKKAQTAFLATSLICVASSTLSLALTGIGAVRDSNYAQQDEVNR